MQTLVGLLTELLKKDNFHWHDEASLAFKNLKEVVTQAPVLVLPNFTLPIQLETDASGVGIDTILNQNCHSITFFSKKMSSPM